MKKRLVTLISTDNKTPEEIREEVMSNMEKYTLASTEQPQTPGTIETLAKPPGKERA